MEEGIKGEKHSELSPQMDEAAEEDNVPELMPVLDHGHGHHGHGSGIAWLDVIVGISAIFISVVSLVVSIGHGKTMEQMVEQNQKMVEASTLPLLMVSATEFDASGRPFLRLLVTNGGVGPAIIDRFEIRYRGTVYTSDEALFRACCLAAMIEAKKGGHTQLIYSNVSGLVLPAHQEIDPITIKPAKDGIALFNTFNIARDSDEITYHACYCSVLNECWVTNFDRRRPQPVKECRIEAGEKLW